MVVAKLFFKHMWFKKCWPLWVGFNRNARAMRPLRHLAVLETLFKVWCFFCIAYGIFVFSSIFFHFHLMSFTAFSILYVDFSPLWLLQMQALCISFY